MKSRVIKRTVYIDGRKTGVSLEHAFWSILTEIARTQGVTVSQVVTRSKSPAKGETCPPRSACLYSTMSVQKTAEVARPITKSTAGTRKLGSRAGAKFARVTKNETLVRRGKKWLRYDAPPVLRLPPG